MLTVLAIDPGKHGVGAAIYGGGVLRHCAYIPAPGPAETHEGAAAWRRLAREVRMWAEMFGSPPFDVLALEVPQIYDPRQRAAQGKSHIKPADLMELQGIQGAIAATVPAERIWSGVPKSWKGGLKKEVHHKQTAPKLSSEERAAAMAGFPKYKRNGEMLISEDKSLDVMDAICLGLWIVSRVTKDRPHALAKAAGPIPDFRAIAT